MPAPIGVDGRWRTPLVPHPTGQAPADGRARSRFRVAVASNPRRWGRGLSSIDGPDGTWRQRQDPCDERCGRDGEVCQRRIHSNAFVVIPTHSSGMDGADARVDVHAAGVATRWDGRRTSWPTHPSAAPPRLPPASRGGIHRLI